MNNFKNPYVDPYSFQGNHFGYDRNPTNPYNFHSSLNNQVGMEQTGNQIVKKNQSNKQKNIPSIQTME